MANLLVSISTIGYPIVLEDKVIFPFGNSSIFEDSLP